ncbi:MAG: tyrosine-type recombinase/integrase [Lachnospiraceae bacterium]|nr:tyrosine-type recombinase/integrase [Lachnospiraceae bacterium]
MNLDYYLEDYVNSIVAEGKSESTVSSYKSDLRKFINYLKEDGLTDLKDVNDTKVNSYLLFLERDSSDKTVARNVAAIRSFFRYLDHKRVIDSDLGFKLNSPKIKKTPMPSMNDEERLKLYNSITGDDFTCYRDRLIIAILVETKIRVTELINLKVEDVNLLGSYILVKHGDKQEAITVSGRVKENLLKCKELKPNLDGDTYLFLSRRGKPYTRQGMWKLIRKYGLKAGITKSIYPEMLRR